jgi:cytochrome P450
LKLQLGSKLGIIVSSPNLAREVLKDHDITFANRDVPDVARIAAYGGSDIAWSPYGPEWRMLRKVCVLKMLSNSTLDSVYELRRREVRNIIAYIYSKPGSPINVGEQTFLTILNVVTSMLWGGTVQGEERGSLGAEFRRVVADMTELVGAPNISDFFPALARFDLQGLVKKMSGLAPKFDQIFDRMIEKQLSIDALGDRAGASSKDFLQFLLKVKDEGDVKTPLTMTHIKALLMVCFSLHDDNEMIRYACDCRSHYEASC